MRTSDKEKKRRAKFVRLARQRTKMSVAQFGHATGMPRVTVMSLCNAIRQVNEEQLYRIQVATGAELAMPDRHGPAAEARVISPFWNAEDYSEESYARWLRFQKAEADAWMTHSEAFLEKAKMVLQAASHQKKLLIALYLFERALEDISKRLGLEKELARTDAIFAEEIRILRQKLDESESPTDEMAEKLGSLVAYRATFDEFFTQEYELFCEDESAEAIQAEPNESGQQ